MRKMYFNGSFYDDNCDELNEIFNGRRCRGEAVPRPIDSNIKQIRAIVVPHAGYFYSGETANRVYKLLKGDYKRVIVLGPSHHLYFQNASIALEEQYQTPCGNIKYIKKAHGEHSTETQMPFIKHYLEKSKVVEIVYGDIDYRALSQVLGYLLDDDDNLIVISTDLSHFYNENDARKLDEICIDAVEKLDLDIVDKGCEACGGIGLKALIDIANKKNLKSLLIDYRTSADASNDKTRVVGYMSGVLFN